MGDANASTSTPSPITRDAAAVDAQYSSSTHPSRNSSPPPAPPKYPPNPSFPPTSPPDPSSSLQPLSDADLQDQLNVSTMNLIISTSKTFTTYYVPRLLIVSSCSFGVRRWVLPYILASLRWAARYLFRGLEKLLWGVSWVGSWGVLYGIGIACLAGLFGSIAMLLIFQYPKFKARSPLYTRIALHGFCYSLLGYLLLQAFVLYRKTASRRHADHRGSKATLSNTKLDLDAIDEATRLRLETLQRASEERRHSNTKVGGTESSIGAVDEEEELDRETERWARKVREDMLKEELAKRARGGGFG